VEAQVFVWRGVIGESRGVEWELGDAILEVYEGGDAEMDVVDCWGGVEDVGSGGESEGEWDLGDLTLDGKSDWAGAVVWHRQGREIDVRKVDW